MVYVGSDDVYALNASTGALFWSYYAGGGYSSPAVANGVVLRDVNDAILVEDVRNQGDAEQSECGERELERDPPQVNVALRTELSGARGKHDM
jgi:hypothetical protein